MDDFVTITKRRARPTSELTDCPEDGKIYNLTEGEKSALIKMSPSYLQKDRCRENPTIPFKRYGRSVRYSRD